MDIWGLRVLSISVSGREMSLQEVKSLARSPHNNWVFNSSRVIPKGISEDFLCTQPLELERTSAVKKIPEFSFNGLSGANLKDSGLHLEVDSYERILSDIGEESLDAMNLCSLSVVSPLIGQIDVSVLKTSEFEVSMNPSVICKPTQLDKSNGFGDCGVSFGDDVRDESHLHTVSKKGSSKKSSKCV